MASRRLRKSPHEEELPIAPVLRHYGADIEDDDPARWVSIECPFHSDSRASASYSETGFMCHGCGEKGNAITIIMKKESLNGIGAKRFYESLLGEDQPVVSRPTRRRRRRVFE